MATTKVQHPCSGNVHVDVVLSMLLRFEFTKLHYHLKFLSGRFLFFQTMRFESSRIAFQTAGFGSLGPLTYLDGEQVSCTCESALLRKNIPDFQVRLWQCAANTAWAFAVVKRRDEKLFAALLWLCLWLFYVFSSSSLLPTRQGHLQR